LPAPICLDFSDEPFSFTGHPNERAATILGTRSDGGTYSGIITYTAKAPVNVQVLHQHGRWPNIQNQTSTITSPLPQSGSVPFSGNALVIHSSSGNRPLVTFAVNAMAGKPITIQPK